MKLPSNRVLTLIAVAAVASLFIFGGKSPSTNTSPEYSRPQQYDTAGAQIDLAGTACREAVKRQANDPSRVEWIGQEVTPGADGTYQVRGEFRAPNKLGAMVRASVTCEVRKTSSGDWQITRLTEKH
ncbi:hypothetical protein [Cupriavidus sp. AcVe19-6a]|uniref:hypothetical protein n=1 Tax=Cupriavidus sp. AcVe19-6a TaxID=2821358 RepID=UPI001AE93A6D|nr:hypothetical protein [Cupriavidus sp. AcVe19-6a]MBP0634897.1 hypothetical protein [Cupriavidus sp. AcVe19-6a]